MTLSILAREPDTGLLGCAVTSCAIAAGRRILHARAGVGVAVAQASSLLVWGEQLLDAAAVGTDPAEAVAALARADNQLALVDATGRVGVHTGADCQAHAGHADAEQVSAQANLAARPDAWKLMIDAYLSTSGALAERLVAALGASGGDVRGQQGAAVIVTGATVGAELEGYWYEPHVDLRVDDHRDPVGELARILELHRAHGEMRRVMDLPAEEQRQVLEPLLARHPGDPHLQRAMARATAPS